MNKDDWRTEIATIAANLATKRKITLNCLGKAKREDGENISGPMRMNRCGMNLLFLEQGMFGKPMDQKLSVTIHP
jgi:hypothetical protein